MQYNFAVIKKKKYRINSYRVKSIEALTTCV